MKVKLKDIKPNPFKKRINKGRLSKEKIERLAESIEKDGFWDNVMGRKHEGEIQIAYGHHRLAAAKKVYGPNHCIDLKLEKLDESQMLRILANENVAQETDDTICQIDIVKQCKSFLESQLCVRPAGGVGLSNRSVAQRKAKGIGALQISEFLGEKNWSETKVLSLFRLDNKLIPEVKEKLKNVGHVGASKKHGISRATGEILVQLPKNEQARVAKIVEKQKLSSLEVRPIVKAINSGDEKLAKQARKVQSMDDLKDLSMTVDWKERADKLSSKPEVQQFKKALKSSALVNNMRLQRIQINLAECMAVIQETERKSVGQAEIKKIEKVINAFNEMWREFSVEKADFRIIKEEKHAITKA